MLRWSLRLAQFDIDLQWLKGEDHAAPDALSRLHCEGPPEPPIDATFPDDTTHRVENQGPGAGRRSAPDPGAACSCWRRRPCTTGLGGGYPTGSGGRACVPLATLGPTGRSCPPEVSLVTFCALQRLRDYEGARSAMAPRLPRAVILGCRAGGAFLALQGLLKVQFAVDPDWTTLECARASTWSRGVHLVRTPLACEECMHTLTVRCAQPGRARRSTGDGHDPRFSGATSWSVRLDSLGATAWRENLRSRLEQGRCTAVEGAMLFPTGKHRVFAVAVRRRAVVKPGTLSAKLVIWNLCLQPRAGPRSQPSARSWDARESSASRSPPTPMEAHWAADQRSTHHTSPMMGSYPMPKTSPGRTSRVSPLPRRTSRPRRRCGGSTLHGRWRSSRCPPCCGRP